LHRKTGSAYAFKTARKAHVTLKARAVLTSSRGCMGHSTDGMAHLYQGTNMTVGIAPLAISVNFGIGIGINSTSVLKPPFIAVHILRWRSNRN
jgi:hypothetical protein